MVRVARTTEEMAAWDRNAISSEREERDPWFHRQLTSAVGFLSRCLLYLFVP
jgi:hypothetical protein